MKSSPEDKLTIRKLKADVHLGVTSVEREKKQEILINCSFIVNAYQIAQLDSLSEAKTIDYDHLSQKLLSFLANTSYQLIETLAEALSVFIFKSFSQIADLELELIKPNALSNAEAAIINIKRKRSVLLK